jgi:hypothetical protein
MLPPRLKAIAVLAASFAAGVPGSALAAAADAYYERAVMDDADQRCKLFPPEMGSALEAAEAQARGAALRSGADQAALNAVARRASAKVAAVSCASPDIATAAARVRTAFAGYSKLQRMNYPGDLADWTADRSTSRQAPIWKLWQREDVRQGRVVFGLAGKDGPSNLIVTASFADGAAPYAAQLVMRDVNFAPEPFLNSIQASASGHMPLSARMPPQSGTRLFMAEARGQGDPSLLPLGARSGVVFRFPKAAARVLAQLDPREAVAIEFLVPSPAGGDETRAAYVEVGDFAAGWAFLEADQR